MHLTCSANLCNFGCWHDLFWLVELHDPFINVMFDFAKCFDQFPIFFWSLVGFWDFVTLVSVQWPEDF